MPLSKSLATTALIFLAVWGALIWKSAPLANNQTSLSEPSTATTPAINKKTASPLTAITLVGLKKKVALSNTDEISQHWQDFYNFNELHSSVSNTISSKVYGYYRPLDDNFNSVELTVGYNSKNQSITGFEVLETFDTQHFETLMENSKSWDTTPAWNAIDTNRMVTAVLEEYVIAASGDVTTTNVYVHYK